MHGQGKTLTWTSNTCFRIDEAPGTRYENDEVIADTHLFLDDEGKQDMVMGDARLKDGKIYHYDHMRKLSY